MLNFPNPLTTIPKDGIILFVVEATTTEYGLKKDMSDANVVTVKGENTLSRTFSGMKKGKTYYVQVRTYMLENGVRYYSGYCTTKTITIKK